MIEYEIKRRRLHDKQREFVECGAKRVIIRAGRRSGKTTGVADFAIGKFLERKRVLYATPTADQIGRFWFEIQRALRDPIGQGYLYKNETAHIVEVPGTEIRIRAKTAWNADTMRGDYADVLIYDEWQLMNEDAWGVVGAPMLLDNNGDGIFIYTPPSLRTAGLSKARDPRHAAKMFKKVQEDQTGRWAAFHFTSHDNPFISREALGEITLDMTSLAYRQEILGEDIDDNPGALWRRDWIGHVSAVPDMERLVVAVDPSATSTGAECGIVVCGKFGNQFYVFEDLSLQASPAVWGNAVVTAYHKWRADSVIAEQNNGGEMVSLTIQQSPNGLNVPVKLVHASRGKQTRAEPISAIYEHGRGNHVGAFPRLEDELCQWEPGQKSPNRLDALVWGATELMLDPKRPPAGEQVDVQMHKRVRPSRWRR